MKSKSIPILVVEDDPSEQEHLKHTLSQNGYQVYTSNDSDAALDLANQVLPHLVILDENIPGTDGYNLCRQLRNSLRFGSSCL